MGNQSRPFRRNGPRYRTRRRPQHLRRGAGMWYSDPFCSWHSRDECRLRVLIERSRSPILQGPGSPRARSRPRGLQGVLAARDRWQTSAPVRHCERPRSATIFLTCSRTDLGSVHAMQNLEHQESGCAAHRALAVMASFCIARTTDAFGARGDLRVFSPSASSTRGRVTSGSGGP